MIRYSAVSQSQFKAIVVHSTANVFVMGLYVSLIVPIVYAA